MTAARRRFTPEFKDELCREVIKTSKPIKDVATAYGVGAESFRNWLGRYREANGGTEADLTVSEQARLKEFEREVQELRAETAFLKKPALTSRGSSGSEHVRGDRLPII
jgi:transposase